MAINPGQRIHRYEKNYSSYRLISVLVVSCLLMYQDYQGGYTKTLRTYLSALAYPLSFIANLPKNTLDGLQLDFSERSEIIDEIKILKEENIQLKSEIQEVYKLESENKRLYALLDSKPDGKTNFIFADIVAISPIKERHQIVVNKGSNHGIRIGDAVADSNGIVGHVIRDQIFSSEVLLISDLEHAIPVEIAETGERTIAYGTGDMNQLSINSMPLNSKIKIGNAVITSGLGDRYPEGFPIGEISTIEKENGENFLTVYLKPFANLKIINEIWIIQSEESLNE